MKKDTLRPKQRMQDVSFSEVADFLDYLPPGELEIVERLRELVFQAIPDAKEHLAYNVPFYKRHTYICFIWPAAIPWGKVSQDGVRLGFTKGYMLHDEINYLDKGDRKQVYCKDFNSPSEIDETILLTYLVRAAALDEEAHLQKLKS